MIDLDKFAIATIAMRTAQRNYFRDRTSLNLQAAKEHEQHVDRIILEYEATRPIDPDTPCKTNLFDDNGGRH